MANNINPQRTTPAETVFPNAQQNPSNANSYYRRPIYTSLWTRQPSVDINNPVYASGEQQNNTKPNLLNTLVRSLSRTTDSIDSNIQNSFSSINRTNQIPQESPPNYQSTLVNNNQPVQIHNPYFETRQQFSPVEQTASYPGNNNAMQDETVYYQDEYYNYEKPSKKKGLSSKIDRFVQRFGKLNKQSSAQSVESEQFERQLTADELALNARYSDKTRSRIITLPSTDQTQPVDVRVHSESNLIYLCDIGRSIIEIYDIHGTLLHTIQDSTMIKFQPTAIIVAFDGTMIVGSHFNHCLYMYAPSESSTDYSYKQYRLGTQGNKAHEFEHPAGITMDEKTGNVFVCDRGNYRIQVIRPEGVCERIIELFLNTKKKIPLEPIRVSIQQGLNQLVCLIGSGDAICFLPIDSLGSVYIDPLYITDENGVNIDGASGLAVDTHDRIFISDTNHHRIVICTPEGGYITSIGTEGNELDQLKRPCGLDVTTDGTIVVTEPGNKRLHLFGLVPEKSNVDNSTPPNDVKEEVGEFL